MTAAEAITELRRLAGVFPRGSVERRLVAETAQWLAEDGMNPLVELKLRMLRRRAAVRAAYS